jgi:hypothetical protein
MSAEDSGGAFRRDAIFGCAAHDPCFADAGNGYDQLGDPQQCWNCKRYRVVRNLLHAGKPSLRHLLLAAQSVKQHNLGIERISEIRFRGIVEGKVAIFSNTEKAYLRVGEPKLGGIVLACLLRVRRTSINFKKLFHPHFAGQPFAEIAAERGRVIPRQIHIFIHMKAANLIPGYISKARELIEDNNLRSPGSKYNSYRAMSLR